MAYFARSWIYFMLMLTLLAGYESIVDIQTRQEITHLKAIVGTVKK